METQHAIWAAQLLSWEIQMQGMIAENQHRLSCGNSIAYDESAFDSVRQEIDGHIEFMRRYG